MTRSAAITRSAVMTRSSGGSWRRRAARSVQRGRDDGNQARGERRSQKLWSGDLSGGELGCGDRGSVAVLMCFIVAIGGLLVTFLVDAGAQLQAANRADTYSSEAARAASIAVGPVPGAGVAALQAAAAARTYLAQAGVTDFQVTITGPAAVAVQVTVFQDTPILGVSVSQTRTHTAQLQVGVTSGAGVSG